jgi:hypothetical protein
MASPGMLHRVGLVETDVSEELSTSIIGVTRIGEFDSLFSSGLLKKNDGFSKIINVGSV